MTDYIIYASARLSISAYISVHELHAAGSYDRSAGDGVEDVHLHFSRAFGVVLGCKGLCTGEQQYALFFLGYQGRHDRGKRREGPL